VGKTANIHLKVSVEQKNKILFWLYTRCMVFAAKLGLIDTNSAYQKCVKYGLNTLYYRIGKGPWGLYGRNSAMLRKSKWRL